MAGRLVKERLIGNGSFGVVFQATDKESGDTVAVKKVLQDRRFKNRELEIMRLLRHVNVVELKDCFYTNGERPDEIYLNLMLEFIPETIYKVIRQYGASATKVPPILAKLYMYQVARSLAYIHSLGVCHRDIKPQNLLLDPTTHAVKLCDFGSAKILVQGENNIAYICSRYYRAPELIFGCSNYSTVIDVWSYGCVFAELFLGQPLFPGENNIDQMVEIIKILGTPTREEICNMNRNLAEFKFPLVLQHSWVKVFRDKAPSDCVDLMSKLLLYDPRKRYSPMQACAHDCFDDLREGSSLLPDGRPIPARILFNFTPEEIRIAGELYPKLCPRQASEQETRGRGIGL